MTSEFQRLIEIEGKDILSGKLKGIIILLFLTSVLIRFEFALYRPSRTIYLKIAADSDFRKDREWCFRAEQLVADSSKRFESYFGIKLKIRSIGCWYPSESHSGLVDLFGDLIKSVNKKDCDVVLGLTSKHCPAADFFGMASYDQGYILIRELHSKPLMRFTLEHELCHLLGALDRSKGDTVMNVRNIGRAAEFDDLTTELVLLNKFRNFEINLSPLSKSKLDEVIPIYCQIKEMNPGLAGINMMLASLHLENGDIQSALKECRLAKRNDPAYPGIPYIMGRALLLNGDIEKAIKELKKACCSMPGDYQAHSNLASAYLKIGKIGKAKKESHEAIEINPNDANAYSCLAYALYKEGKFSKAAAACLKAASIDPHLPEPFNLLGNIHAKERKIEEAKLEYMKALKINPNYFTAHFNLGIIYFKKNLLPESSRHFMKALEINPESAEACHILALIFFLRKEYTSAWEYLNRGEELGVEASKKLKKDLLDKLKTM